MSYAARTMALLNAKHAALDVAEALTKVRTLEIYASHRPDAVEVAIENAREALEKLNSLAPALGIAANVLKFRSARAGQTTETGGAA